MGQKGAVPLLDAAIEAMDRAETISKIPPAKVAFDSARDLLTTVKVGPGPSGPRSPIAH